MYICSFACAVPQSWHVRAVFAFITPDYTCAASSCTNVTGSNTTAAMVVKKASLKMASPIFHIAVSRVTYGMEEAEVGVQERDENRKVENS